jgi:hypothetical protein
MEDKDKIYLPHSEDRTVFYPSSFVFKENIWGCSVAYKDDITKPEVVSFREFTKDESNEITPEQIETVAKKYLPPDNKVASIAIQPTYIQLFISDSFCPIWLIKDICGNDFEDYIKNMYFDMNYDNQNTILFYFECSNYEKAQLIIENYQETLDECIGHRADVNLKYVYYDNYTDDTGDDYYFFVFEYVEPYFPQAFINIADELEINLI